MAHEFRQSWMGRKLLRRVGWRPVPTLSHWCPACKEIHDFAVEQPFGNGAKWSFNNDLLNPTFMPSMVINTGPYPASTKRPNDVCHYFLKDGHMQYLGDCTHDMRGQTVLLPDMPFTESDGVMFVDSTPVKGVR